MRTIVPYILIAVFFLPLFRSIAQESEFDPRLDEILDDIREAQAKAGAGAKARTAKYIEDLKALEKKVQATGDLDKVLQVTRERESWEAGTPTPEIDPKDHSVILGLRKLRYYFEQELVKIRAADKVRDDQTKIVLAGKLDVLVKALTTELKIPEALEVRKVKQQLMAGNLVIPEKIKSPVDPSITSGKPRGGSFDEEGRIEKRYDYFSAGRDAAGFSSRSRNWADSMKRKYQQYDEIPDDSSLWIRLGVGLVVSGDQEGYSDFRGQVADLVKGGTKVEQFERGIKMCLLLPGNELLYDQLPVSLLVEKVGARGYPQWRRMFDLPVVALADIRKGNLDKAEEHLKRAGILDRPDANLKEGAAIAKATALAIKSLLEVKRGDFDEAKDSLEKTELLYSTTTINDIDRLLVKVLCQEVKWYLENEQ